MTPNNWEEKIKYIVAAPFLNPPFDTIPGKDAKRVMDWQSEEILKLLASQRETLAVETLKMKKTENTSNDTPSTAYNDYTYYNDGYNRGLTDAAAHIRKQ